MYKMRPNLLKIIGIGLTSLALSIPGCAAPRGIKPVESFSSNTHYSQKQEKGFQKAFKEGEKLTFTNDDWIGFHSSYPFLYIRDYWQTPAETQKRKKGDCEDHAIYMSEQLEKYNVPNRVVVGLAQKGKLTSAHIWGEIEENGETYIVDLSGYVDPSELPNLKLPDNWIFTSSGMKIPKKYFEDNSKMYQGFFSFQGPFTRQRLNEIQRHAHQKYLEYLFKETLNPMNLLKKKQSKKP